MYLFFQRNEKDINIDNCREQFPSNQSRNEIFLQTNDNECGNIKEKSILNLNPGKYNVLSKQEST